MVSRIRIGPEGGPYVIVDENNGVLDITTPNDDIDLGNNDLINAALGGVLDAKGNDITNVDALDSNSVNTEQLGDATFFAGEFSGSSSEARLSDALSSIPPGSELVLEADSYDGVTIDSQVRLRGQGSDIDNNGTQFGTVSVDVRGIHISNIRLGNSADVTVNADFVAISDSVMLSGADITVAADNFLLTSIGGDPGSVTFNSGTSSGTIGSRTSGLTVTDNGTNNVIPLS